jgi:hypothetical protein
VRLRVAETKAPVKPLPVSIKSRDESLGVTRLAIDLGATNLMIASLRIETSDPLFERLVAVAIPELANDSIREQTVCTGAIYRVDLNGKIESHLEIPIDKQIRGRELIVLINNGDSPRLVINAVGADRRMLQLVFLAREPGRYQLLSGNTQCSTPRYDLSELSDKLKSAAAIELRPASLIASPDYKPTNNLAALPLTGARIDLGAWKFRKPVQVSKAGAQQIELDPDVLARAAPDQRDLRIVTEDRQLPFLPERTSISRSISLAPTAANDPKKPSLSRWSLRLSQAGTPIARITCASGSALFQREMRLWEEVADERSNSFPRELGRATWKKVPGEATREFAIHLEVTPRSDTLFLETDNGDNPAIDLRDFRGHCPVTRLVFKADSDSTLPIWIYYGNRGGASPRYDVTLIANQLFRAERASATLGAQERPDSKTERITQTLSGSARSIFLGVFGVVVVGLLLVISRLLPKAQ